MNVIPYALAVEKLTDAFGKILVTETVPVSCAMARILACDVYSPEDFPPFDRSTVDGYAHSYKDSSAASAAVPSVLTLKGEVAMGEYTEARINSGECFYVPTGAMLPAGADAVTMIENAEVSNGEVYVSSSLHRGENVVFKGADVHVGETVIRRGERLLSPEIGLLCSLGINFVRVYKKLSFYVVSTGDELVAPDEECQKGKIRDTNTAVLTAELSGIGNVVGAMTVNDDYNKLSATVRKGLSEADVVILSGGSSVGKADYTAKLFSEYGRPLFGGVAVKPGKPTLAAEADNKLLIGLPGHPMAAFTSYRLIVLRALLNACGSDTEPPVVCRAAKNFPGGRGRSAVIPVRLVNKDEFTAAEPLFYKSGMLSVISSADGFALLPDYVEGVPAGAPLEIYRI